MFCLSEMLSTKLLETTSTLNGKKEEKRVKIAEEKPKTKSSKKSELSNQQQIKKKVVKSRSPAKITPKKEPKLAKEEPKEKPNLQKKEPKLAEKVKTKVKEQSSLKESKKEAKTPDKTKTEKPAASDKQSRFLKYQQWQNRAGPSAPGSKEVPKVCNCVYHYNGSISFMKNIIIHSVLILVLLHQRSWPDFV